MKRLLGVLAADALDQLAQTKAPAAEWQANAALAAELQPKRRPLSN